MKKVGAKFRKSFLSISPVSYFAVKKPELSAEEKARLSEALAKKEDTKKAEGVSAVIQHLVDKGFDVQTAKDLILTDEARQKISYPDLKKIVAQEFAPQLYKKEVFSDDLKYKTHEEEIKPNSERVMELLCRSPTGTMPRSELAKRLGVPQFGPGGVGEVIHTLETEKKIALIFVRGQYGNKIPVFAPADWEERGLKIPLYEPKRKTRNETKAETEAFLTEILSLLAKNKSLNNKQLACMLNRSAFEHLRILERKGLVRKLRKGKYVYWELVK